MLTKADFKQDIIKYEQCLSGLQKKLECLPIDGKIWEGLKLKKARRCLQSEIDHVAGLRKMAKDGLKNF